MAEILSTSKSVSEPKTVLRPFEMDFWIVYVVVYVINPLLLLVRIYDGRVFQFQITNLSAYLNPIFGFSPILYEMNDVMTTVYEIVFHTGLNHHFWYMTRMFFYIPLWSLGVLLLTIIYRRICTIQGKFLLIAGYVLLGVAVYICVLAVLGTVGSMSHPYPDLLPS